VGLDSWNKQTQTQ